MNPRARSVYFSKSIAHSQLLPKAGASDPLEIDPRFRERKGVDETVFSLPATGQRRVRSTRKPHVFCYMGRATSRVALPLSGQRPVRREIDIRQSRGRPYVSHGSRL